MRSEEEETDGEDLRDRVIGDCLHFLAVGMGISSERKEWRSPRG